MIHLAFEKNFSYHVPRQLPHISLQNLWRIIHKISWNLGTKKMLMVNLNMFEGQHQYKLVLITLHWSFLQYFSEFSVVCLNNNELFHYIFFSLSFTHKKIKLCCKNILKREDKEFVHGKYWKVKRGKGGKIRFHPCLKTDIRGYIPCVDIFTLQDMITMKRCCFCVESFIHPASWKTFQQQKMRSMM